MSINEIKTFIIENYYKRIGFFKLIKKIPDSRNANEQYQSFVIKKNRKSVKQSEIITYQPKAF